ncbi:MAG: translation elongation factor Ts [Christensenellales bacterium]|jgi:elongation factor Ts|nr:elongation factor Ts [Clostridiales bacterium]
MQITAAMVKALRDRTQAGMMDCKNALVATEGDMEKAVEYLREKGLAASNKKSGRIAAEGAVDSYLSKDGKIGSLVEVNCETDFVGKTDTFQTLSADVALQVAKTNPKVVSKEEAEGIDDKDVLLEQPFVNNPSITVSTLVNEATLASGEKISVRRFERYEAQSGLVDSYIHMGGKIGVLVEVNCSNPDTAENETFKTLCHDIALQIAASNPLFITKDNVPQESLEKEREILRAQALNEGKPEKIVERMVIGRIEKYYKEVCLVEQPFVKNPDVSVQTLINDTAKELQDDGVSVARFVRFERGEGIERRSSNLADEIAEMTKKA